MKKNNKKGFTLIELLALIVLISILLLMVGPNVTERLHEARIQSYINSLRNICKTVTMSEHNSRIKNYKEFDLTMEVSQGGVDVEGRRPDYGLLDLYSDGSIALTARYDNYCFYKTVEDDDVYEYDCKDIAKKELKFNGCGTESDPFLIECIEDLVLMSKIINDSTNFKKENYVDTCAKDVDFSTAFFKVANHLNFKNNNSYINPDRTDFGDINGINGEEPLITELTTGAGFEPIGIYDTNNQRPFKGTFDGNDKGLWYLYSNRGAYDYIGLFGYLSNANVKNYNINNANITGKKNVGLLVGISNLSDFNKIKVSGTISSSSGSRLGGLGGYISSNGTTKGIHNSSSNVQITNIVNSCTSLLSYVGGLAGRISRTNINNSNSNANIIDNCGQYVGGFVGGFDFGSTNSPDCVVSDSFSTGSINCTNCEFMGGFSGSGSSNSVGKYTMKDSYSNVNITASNSKHIGGFLGYSNLTEIKNSYSLGDINATNSERIGGLAGECNKCLYSGRVQYFFFGGNIDGTNSSQIIGPLIGLYFDPSDGNSESKPIPNDYSATDLHIYYDTDKTISGTLNDYTKLFGATTTHEQFLIEIKNQ